VELDDELRRMFAEADDRLDVPVRPDAEQLIVAGARRVRRRRIATATAGGAVAVVAVVLGGIALAGGTPDAMPPATKEMAPTTRTSTAATSTTSPVTSTTTQQPQNNSTQTNQPTKGETGQTRPSDRVDPPPVLNLEVLGPTGIRSVVLGQSLDSAETTAMLGTKTGGNGACDQYELLLDSTPSGSVYLSPADGGKVEAISSSVTQTPEGVGPGWTVKQVSAVYPDVTEAGVADYGHGFAAVPGNPNASYRLTFNTAGVLTGYTLENVSQPCFG